MGIPMYILVYMTGTTYTVTRATGAIYINNGSIYSLVTGNLNQMTKRGWMIVDGEGNVISLQGGYPNTWRNEAAAHRNHALIVEGYQFAKSFKLFSTVEEAEAAL